MPKGIGMVDGAGVANLAVAVDRVQRHYQFRVAQHRQVGVVRSDNHLAALLRLLEVVDNRAGDVGRIEVILGRSSPSSGMTASRAAAFD